MARQVRTSGEGCVCMCVCVCVVMVDLRVWARDFLLLTSCIGDSRSSLYAYDQMRWNSILSLTLSQCFGCASRGRQDPWYWTWSMSIWCCYRQKKKFVVRPWMQVVDRDLLVGYDVVLNLTLRFLSILFNLCPFVPSLWSLWKTFFPRFTFLSRSFLWRGSMKWAPEWPNRPR